VFSSFSSSFNKMWMWMCGSRTRTFRGAEYRPIDGEGAAAAGAAGGGDIEEDGGTGTGFFLSSYGSRSYKALKKVC
jgi:hypothetical protein